MRLYDQRLCACGNHVHDEANLLENGHWTLLFMTPCREWTEYMHISLFCLQSSFFFPQVCFFLFLDSDLLFLYFPFQVFACKFLVLFIFFTGMTARCLYSACIRGIRGDGVLLYCHNILFQMQALQV